MCGSDVEGKWICPSRLPVVYYIGLDDKDKFVKSSFDRKDLEDKEKIVLINKIDYKGCPFWRKDDPTF